MIKEKSIIPSSSKAAGTFILDAARDPDPSRNVQKKKGKGWKEDARKLRKKRGY